MTKQVRICLLFLLACIPLASGQAQDLSGQELRSLDGQVQEIKSDVLSIASELSNLEERLLYPSNTQVALFVAMDHGDDFRLDAVKVEIDGWRRITSIATRNSKPCKKGACSAFTRATSPQATISSASR